MYIMIASHWSGLGKFTNGFDFTLARDANIYFRTNIGMEDKIPHAKINLQNNASATTVGTSGRFYKMVFTNGTTYTCKFALANNKMTYLPSYTTDVVMWVNGNAQCNTASRSIQIGIVKNGDSTAVYSPMSIRIPASSSNQSFGFSSTIYLPDVKQNDNFSLYGTVNGTGETILIEDLTWFAKAQ